MADAGDAEVLAGGGVVWRLDAEGAPEVLLVHRPRYDDWSFPKGKLDRGETLAQCTQREVLEETGLTCELGPELVDITYRDHKGRSKLVRYWAMTVQAGDFAANDEVDVARWAASADAVALLTYPHDHAVLDALGRRVRFI